MDLKPSEETLGRSTSSMEDVCTAVSEESGDVCGERSGLQILGEFRKLYEDRIASIDGDSENASDMKVRVMEEWIRDLDAQNVMLVKTVQELEEAAYQRVRILEDKLRQTSSLINDNMTRVEQPNHHRLDHLTERLDSLEHDGEFLKQKIKNLQNDITGLLELVRRGYHERRWTLEGIHLCELRESDIPINFGGEGAPKGPRTPGDKDLTGHEKFKLFSEIEKRVSSEDSQSTTTIDNELELINLREELKKKNKEVEILQMQLDSIEKEALEAREALTLEVAQKHDQTIILKDQLEHLEHHCRQTNMKLQFQDDVINEMRSKLKQKIKIKGESAMSSARNQKSGVTWGHVSTHELSDQEESNDNAALKTLQNLKTTIKTEQYELVHLKNKLTEILETLDFYDKKAYEKGLSDAQKKLQDMENLLETYNIQNAVSNTSKLKEAIEIVSKICLDKGNEILQIELILQDLRELKQPLKNPPENPKNPSNSSSRPQKISRDDFNLMEEFRVCTVEAQAAVEDLQEEMSSVVSNLSQRHKLFTDLKKSLEKTHGELIKTGEDISTLINSLKDHIEEKIVSKGTISSGENKLKDLKNEINECLGKFKFLALNEISTNQEKLTERELSRDVGDHLYDSLMDNVVEEIEYILCNLRVFVGKDDLSCNLLIKCRDQLMRVEQGLNELVKRSDDVLKGEEIARDAQEGRIKRLEKLEGELDDAHTRMQDNLEEIVKRSRNYESLGDEEDGQRFDEGRGEEEGVEALRSVVSSKDKLIEHKDEIIRIQKDSMCVTQEEMKDLQRRLQKKIDAQLVIISEHLEEKKHLLEQSKLQNDTIEHLRIAVVEAKKNLDRQSGGQKSVPDVWNPITPTVFNNGDVHDI